MQILGFGFPTDDLIMNTNNYRHSAERRAFAQVHLDDDSQHQYDRARDIVRTSNRRPFGPRGPRGGRGRWQHNKVRSDKNREENSMLTNDDLAEALKKKLFPGIKDAQDAENKIEANQTFKTIQLTITTR